MRLARTIANWLVSLALMTTLAFAPVASALAVCMPMKADMTMTGAQSQPPCDMPCKDCTGDASKKLCQGDCVCVKAMIASPLPTAMIATLAAKLDPEIFAPQLALVHPPDTPPPRTLPA